MYNKLYVILLGITTLGMISCNQSSIAPQKTEALLSDDTIAISNVNKQSYDLHVKFSNNISFSKAIEANQKIPLLSLLPSTEWKRPTTRGTTPRNVSKSCTDAPSTRVA